MGIEFIILIILLIGIFNLVYYIPNKLKEQEEKQSLYAKELYIRINNLEAKINKITEDLNKNKI